MITVTKLSPFSGKFNKMKLDVTVDQLLSWSNGDGLIQDIMPQLTPDEREFLISGMIPEDWVFTE